jgi:CheY-like chemotaxis protein
MSEKQTILVVDDDEFMRMMIAESVGENYRIIDVGSGAECLAAAAAERPDLVLLDVEMPGMDGYETCRQLKGDLELDSIPVIFISSHDQIEARLQGYEAGAEDYIVKPFAPPELLAKIAGLLHKVSERTQLKEMANYASRTAMTAMSSMSEVGSLLQSLQSFNTCSNYAALVEAVVNGLAPYGIAGAAQLRTPQGPLTRTSHGEASPMETSVISHMAGMERIVQYRNRLSITYDHVSLLVSNMPTDDPERCGRLRDHLAVLVESAEVRAAALIADARSRQRGELIAGAVERITRALAEIDQEQRHSHASTGVAVQDMTTKLERAYVQLALTEKQEEFLAAITSEAITRVLDSQLAETGQQDKMTAVVRELQQMLTF